MDAHLQRALTRIDRGALLRLHDARGQAIAVFEGDVWITQDGDLRDIFVSTGETFVFDRNGLAIVQALRPSRVLLFSAADSGDAATPVPASAPVHGPASYELHSRSRAQRAKAIASAVAQGAARLDDALSRFADGLRAQRAWARQPV